MAGGAAPVVPATNPPPTIAPPTSDGSGTTVPGTDTTSTDPGATEPPATEPETAPPSSTSTTAPPTTTDPGVPAPPVEPRLADVRLRSGPDGVEILGLEPRQVTDEAMAIARLGPDDSVYMQRSTVAQNADGSDADTRLLVVEADGQEPRPVDVDLPIDGTIRLHDTARIDGRWAVLFEIAPAQCPNPEACLGGVYVFWSDDGSVDEIQRKIVWEGGWELLSLSETGVIVGGETESASRSPYVASVTGATGPVPELTILGLDDSYFDCIDCPQGYTINRRGDAVAWVEKDLEGGALVRVVGIDGEPRAAGRIEPGCCASPKVPVASLGDIEVAEGITRPIVIVNEEFRDPSVNPDAAGSRRSTWTSRSGKSTSGRPERSQPTSRGPSRRTGRGRWKHCGPVGVHWSREHPGPDRSRDRALRPDHHREWFGELDPRVPH
jgi:hypothetical protein